MDGLFLLKSPLSPSVSVATAVAERGAEEFPFSGIELKFLAHIGV
jgi:hypothetical protein